jgi:hypothetical protein
MRKLPSRPAFFGIMVAITGLLLAGFQLAGPP